MLSRFSVVSRAKSWAPAKDTFGSVKEDSLILISAVSDFGEMNASGRWRVEGATSITQDPRAPGRSVVNPGSPRVRTRTNFEFAARGRVDGGLECQPHGHDEPEG